MNEAIVEPAPGSTPIRKPTTDPLANAKRQSFRSCSVGSRLRRPLGTGSSRVSWRASMLASTSPMANTPMATTTKSTPESSSMRPNVKREVVLNGSVPMPAIHRPTSIASSAFTIERPASSTTIASPSAISAKYRSEEHTSELQSPCNLVCRLLLEKKKKKKKQQNADNYHLHSEQQD